MPKPPRTTSPPLPASSRSLPLKPKSVSLPSPPRSVSLPPKAPSSRSLPLEPERLSAPSAPTRVSGSGLPADLRASVSPCGSSPYTKLAWSSAPGSTPSSCAMLTHWAPLAGPLRSTCTSVPPLPVGSRRSQPPVKGLRMSKPSSCSRPSTLVRSSRSPSATEKSVMRARTRPAS